MIQFNDSLKGIAPGKYISHRLKKEHISQLALASAVGEHPQTINAVISGRRHLTISLSMRIEEFLGLQEGFLGVMQVYHDCETMRSKAVSHCETPHVRKVLFWDTDINSIDWQADRDFVLKRVMERGTKEDISEIKRYYGI